MLSRLGRYVPAIAGFLIASLPSLMSVFAADEAIEAESVLLRIIDRVDVPARASGVLDALDAVEGQIVAAGALLAQIDDADALLLQEKAETELQLAKMKASNDVAVRSAKAALAYAETDLQHLREAAAAVNRSVSQSELEKAQEGALQAQLDAENEQLNQQLAGVTRQLKECDAHLARRHVELRKILAPIGGVVTHVYRRPGEWVEPGDQILQLVRLDRLRAEGFVNVEDVSGDLQGSPVRVSVNLTGRGRQVFAGEIVFVHPEIDPVNGQMRVWAEVENRDGLLRPGLRGQMSIVPTYSNTSK